MSTATTVPLVTTNSITQRVVSTRPLSTLFFYSKGTTQQFRVTSVSVSVFLQPLLQPPAPLPSFFPSAVHILWHHKSLHVITNPTLRSFTIPSLPRSSCQPFKKSSP
ncbi:hypothetical protein VNO77_42643 [Canavalia gladiata]|uniref:Uncharacterized protein n=1 Tax=Canavalia gladiata TaxID=3824 RepID=A0AAN9JVF7_CANGL